ncbi:MAG: hypothetical protein LBJ59_07145 [Zoogloeaceae bacterium]|jgi:uncharacterized membrane protein|nr:hypothetical protein [Zoogloeaceae bacterium]
MRFQVTPEHVKRQNRKSTLFALFLVLLSAGCAGALLSAKSLLDMILPVIGLSLFVPPILKTYRIIKEGAEAYPVLELNESTGKIIISYKDVVVTVDITQIKNLRLQYKSGRLASAIVTTSSSEVMRFEGYENLEILATALERLTPSDQVTNAKLYHR